MIRRFVAGLGLVLILASACALTSATAASAAPAWLVSSTSNTTVAPGDTIEYSVTSINTGDSPTGSSEYRLHVALPPGITGVTIRAENVFTCPDISGASSFTCTGKAFIDLYDYLSLIVVAQVDPGASGVRTAEFELEGGGAGAPGHTVDPVTISADPALPFGFDALDVAASDAEGDPLVRAGGHPASYTTSVDLNSHTDPDPTVGPNYPIEDLKDGVFELPAGFLGNPGAAETCSLEELTHEDEGETVSLCPSESQIGTLWLRNPGNRSILPTLLGPFPIFNLDHPPGAPARFGAYAARSVITIDAKPRSDGDYGISARSLNTSQALALVGFTLTLWGVPSDPVHDQERGCPGQRSPFVKYGKSCKSEDAPRPFFRMPTTCTASGAGLPTVGRIDPWQDPGDFAERTVFSHEAPGYPYPPGPSLFPAGHSGPEEWGRRVGVEGCGQIRFEPTFAVDTTTNHADSPTGLSVDLGVPQEECWGPKATVQEAEEAPCQSDLHTSEVVLPKGMSVNPSSAVGLAACSPAEIGLTTPVGSAPIHFNEDPVKCPDASKIGSVEIETPLLHDPLKGFVYLAQQGQNPFGSLLSMYLVAEGSGVIVKQAGEIEARPDGQLVTRFDEVPQQPITNLHLELYGGSRASLRTPPSCGPYTTEATLGPWSAVDPVSGDIPAADLVHRSSTFQITDCPGSGGFDPKLSGGTENPLAGRYSPFHLRLTREDGSQELGGLQLHLPPGLLANLSSVSYCPDSVLNGVSADLGSGGTEAGHPSCPAGSKIGTVTVGAGAGVTPFYTDLGRVYWAGPYKGAPVSIAAVVPAVAGPFDLGSVVVRNRVEVDPDTAEITAISDPLPSIIAGIPLDLRDVRIDVDRPDFTLNPTSCEPKSLDALLTSTAGATAARSQHFQAAGCDRLGFKPKLTLRFKGPIHRRANPSLEATYRARSGDANLARAQVKLPPAAFLDNSHIGTVCTRVQFAAQACPARSIYGRASATSPILGYPLEGNVYLRSSNHTLPDLVADLRGPANQPIEVALAGKTDAVKGALRNTFELVPDAPVSVFHLHLFGGKRGLVVMSDGFCANRRASVKLEAQNGRSREFRNKVLARCHRPGKHKHRRGHGRR
jgi:uncharacterized repeat protein (TIGR01451 family)